MKVYEFRPPVPSAATFAAMRAKLAADHYGHIGLYRSQRLNHYDAMELAMDVNELKKLATEAHEHDTRTMGSGAASTELSEVPYIGPRAAIR